MNNSKDFNLDATQKKGAADVHAQFKSWSFCTPGCVTGILMGCNNKTATCNCQFGNK